MILLHGTSSTNYRGIRKEGLDPFHFGVRKTYLTDLFCIALHFAEVASNSTFGTPVICEVDVEEENLWVDMTMYESPIDYLMFENNYCCNDCWGEEDHHFNIPHDERDWRLSLEEVHSVMHLGIIPPSRVKKYHGIFSRMIKQYRRIILV